MPQSPENRLLDQPLTPFYTGTPSTAIEV